MKKNVGGLDKTIRIVIGAVLLLLAMLGQIGVWGYVAGGIVLATGVFSLCGLYMLIGVNTCKMKS